MTVEEAMAKLKELGSDKVREINRRNGTGDNQFGVKLGDIRTVAKTLKGDHELGLELWRTGNLDAMLVSTLILKSKQLSEEEVDNMVAAVTSSQAADWLSSNVVKEHPNKEALRLQWMESSDVMRARLGWSLTTERVLKRPEGLDFDHLLTRLENEMGSAPELVQWTMNFCLGEIGIHFPEHRVRAVAIAEKLGVFRDYPTPKGCTSPFVPLWVAEMVKRQG